MPRVSRRQWAEFDSLINRGYPIVEAARRIGVDKNTAYQRRKRQKPEERAYETGYETRKINVKPGEEYVIIPAGGAPKPHDQLCDEARRALDDFTYFQRRYLGRIPTPWQKEAADRIVEYLASDNKEYVVINAPPGVGKSTTFTCDIPLWLTVRNRGIRGQIGSASTTTARTYIDRIKRLLTLQSPYHPEAEDIARGLAVPAEATLIDDYGIFHPGATDRWSAEAIVVAQHGDRPLVEKEPTWSAFGMDSRFLGMRYDIIIWDDLVDTQSTRTAEAREKQQEWWDNVAERRLEPTGVLILQGQRMGAEDLYRYCLDKVVLEDEDDDEDPEADPDPETPDTSLRQYHHIVFKAHYEDRCQGTPTHKKSSPYYPEGCLLDPRRLPWRDLRQSIANKRNNYAVIFQQEDVDPGNVLVDPIWITGGVDPRTGEIYPGCVDRDRGLTELPNGLYGQLLSVATADPSPTKYWSIQWWIVRCVDGQPQERYLMDHIRQAMDAPSFLDWNNPTQSFTGIMDDWQNRSAQLHHPITTWIVEKNGAQRFLLQYEHVKRWQAQQRVRIIPHETTSNKSDPDFGVQTLAGIYRYGLVRLPYKPGLAFQASQKLIEEVTHWPEFRTDDTVMAQWFLEWRLPQLMPRPKPQPRMARPSWLKNADTYGWRNVG